MLSRFDEYPIHQTPEPLACNVTGDRNVYDRFWFNGFASDASYFFGLTMGFYPNRGFLDCAFSVLIPGMRQHCVHISQAMREHGDMTAGPLQISVVEPMREIRVVLDDNASGLSCDLTFTTRTSAVQEQRQTLWSGTRRTMDATRYDQFGYWTGIIRSPDGELRIDVDECLGIKDRSWGVRRFGEPEPAGPVKGHRPLFLWVPIFWNDHVSHAIFFDGSDGQPFVREGLEAPLYPSLHAVPGIEDGQVRRMATARHRVRYQSGTRWADSAEIDLVGHDEVVRTMRLDPLLRFQQKGIGYGHPKWGHGIWRGDLSIESESFDPLTLDPLALENIHVQHVVRASDGTREGIGILEQFILGPYAPYGFSDLLAGAKS